MDKLFNWKLPIDSKVFIRSSELSESSNSFIESLLYCIANCSWEKVLWAIGALVIVNLDVFLGKNENPQLLDFLRVFLVTISNQAKSRYDCFINIFLFL